MTAIVFETNVLAAALREVRGAVERRNTIPILANVLIEAAADGSVRLTTTDLDVMVMRTLTATVEQPVSFTLDAHRLADVVGSFAKGSQTTIRYEAPAATVSSGRARLRFATLPRDNFPSIVQGEGAVRFTLDAKALTRALGVVRHAVSSEETRYYLNGVFLHARDGKLTFAATDGHRLARYVDNLPDGAADMPDVILRTRCIDLARAAAEARDMPIEMAVTRDKVVMVIGDFTMLAKTIDGTYPDYVRVIPTANTRVAEIDRDSFDEALSRVMVATADRTCAVKVDLARDMLKASITSPEHGVAVDELPCTYTAAPIEIGFNARYLRDALAALDVDQVDMRFADAAAPTLITSPKASNVTLVLMPMRV